MKELNLKLAAKMANKAFIGLILLIWTIDYIEAQDWGSVSVDIDKNVAILENSIFKGRYAHQTYPDGGTNHVMIELLIKSAGNENQANPEGLDAIWTGANPQDNRGSLTGGSTVLYDGIDRKTLHLEWSRGIVQEITVYPDNPVLKIDYISYGVNVVDFCAPGGSDTGNYVFYGGDKWIRDYIIYPDSYYNRCPEDSINDASNGGSLNYNGYFIMGQYNPSNNRGYGRVSPVQATDIIKLLMHKGFELFTYFLRDHEPYTQYLYIITDGKNEIISLGQRIADGTFLNLNTE